MGVENLIKFDFISGLYYNKRKGDMSLYESKFMRYFINYAWEAQVKNVLRDEII
jgi:hypothetical protein